MTRPTLINRRQALATAGLRPFGTSLAVSTSAAVASAAPAPHDLDVRALGAKGDGAADDTAAFQTALDKAFQAGGGRVFVPPGRYLIAGHLIVPQNVTLEGIFAAPPTTPWRNTPDGGSKLAGSILLAVEGGGKVSFTDCHVHCIDPRNTPRPLIHAKAGRLQVRGCEFLEGHAPRDHVVLEAGVIHATISDNTSRAPFAVINHAKDKTILRDNLGDA